MTKHERYLKQRAKGICPNCGKESRPNKSLCQSCADKSSAWHQSHYQQNKFKFLKASYESRMKLKMDVFQHYGNKCQCCGESHIEFLTIDHINGNGNKHRKEVMGDSKCAGTRFYNWLKRNNFPEGFQVLCMNCNFAKAYSGGCPHHR